jgi:ABC-type dipeptide/oligopeptide/nickel transport system ATPase component
MTMLRVEDLVVTYGATTALQGVSLSVDPGEIVALVGESGCGKSTMALTIPQLLPPEADIPSGSVHFNDTDMVAASRKQLEEIRGAEIGMIYQDPLSALNPVLKVGRQISETLRRHLGMTRSQARERAIELIDQVGIPDPEQRHDEYPHQFSGGMRQRLVIAIAISCGPRLLVADEPTTALDVSIQAQVLGLLSQLCSDLGMAMILITHDLHVAASMAHRVEVMHRGRVVENGPASLVLTNPSHEYTRKLRAAIPVLDIAERMDFSAFADATDETPTQPFDTGTADTR